jgi:hypothetical protein
VIEAIPVYWHLLANILKGILAQICKMCFNFLWKGSFEYLGSHLVNWKCLSAPKNASGWGLKDLVSFGCALVVKSLWVFLSSDSLWRSILIAKYIEPGSILDWIQQQRKPVTNVSSQWKVAHKLFSFDQSIPGLESRFHRN